MLIPAALAASCVETPERTAWLGGLPSLLDHLRRRWDLDVDEPFDGPDVTASWVAPCVRADGTPAVLKLPMPHFEGEHELDGLRFWNGAPTVALLEGDGATGAMLLERCEPGTSLRTLPAPEQDVVVADILRELWVEPPAAGPFRSLETMIRFWMDEALAEQDEWADAGLVRAALEMWTELLATSNERVMLATDLHAGNILRAERRPWVAIDPKPFVGEPAYDVTQHLVNCGDRMTRAPFETIARVSDLAGVDPERVRRWTFARAAGELRSDADVDWTAVAGLLAR
jgi:streptomycin 6-kinase